MKKFLALAMALILAVSSLAINVVAADDVTVEMLISAANIVNANVSKGVATFDGSSAGFIKLPVPMLANETITLHIEGTMSSEREPRMYASTAGGNGKNTGMYNNSGEEDLTLGAAYSLDIALTSNNSTDATHVCIKGANSGQQAPKGMTITKLSVTYSGANIDDDRQVALNAAIAAQVSTSFDFMDGGKRYEGEIAEKYTDSNIGSGDYPWLNGAVSGKTRIAAASGRTGALQSGKWLRITVSAGSVTRLYLADYSSDLNSLAPAHAIVNGNITEYYFDGAELASVLAQGDIYGKQLFINTADNTIVTKIEEVTLIGPEAFAYTVPVPVAGQDLGELVATNNDDATDIVTPYWYIEEDTIGYGDGVIAEAGKSYTCVLWLYTDNYAPEELIVVLNGVEAEIYVNDDGVTEIWAEATVTVPSDGEEDPTANRKTGWFVTGPETHAMIIGRAIITLPHEFNDNGDCLYCRYHVDPVAEEETVTE